MSGGPLIKLVNGGYNGAPVSIPALGLGVFQVPSRDAVKCVTTALKAGYRHIDTAHLYGNEAEVGQCHSITLQLILAIVCDYSEFVEVLFRLHYTKRFSWMVFGFVRAGEAIRNSGIPREEIFVTTKLWNSDHGYQNALRAFDRSFKELDLDYVDLYLIHSPIPVQQRLNTWKAMEQILKSGKAKSIGVSNYGIKHLKELLANCEIRPSCNQVSPWTVMSRMQQLGVFLLILLCGWCVLP
jgi:diketogulonate reductase-like aldo/keto reductase